MKWKVSYKLVFCSDGFIETKKYSLVRVRIELTTLALSAPRSTDWANGPCIWEILKGQTIENPGIDPGTFLVVHQPARKRMWKLETETTQLESLLDRSFRDAREEVLSNHYCLSSAPHRAWTTCPLQRR